MSWQKILKYLPKLESVLHNIQNINVKMCIIFNKLVTGNGYNKLFI